MTAVSHKRWEKSKNKNKMHNHCICNELLWYVSYDYIRNTRIVI